MNLSSYPWARMRCQPFPLMGSHAVCRQSRVGVTLKGWSKRPSDPGATMVRRKFGTMLLNATAGFTARRLRLTSRTESPPIIPQRLGPTAPVGSPVGLGLVRLRCYAAGITNVVK